MSLFISLVLIAVNSGENSRDWLTWLNACIGGKSLLQLPHPNTAVFGILAPTVQDGSVILASFLETHSCLCTLFGLHWCEQANSPVLNYVVLLRECSLFSFCLCFSFSLCFFLFFRGPSLRVTRRSTNITITGGQMSQVTLIQFLKLMHLRGGLC